MFFGRRRNRQLTYEQARQVLLEQDAELGPILARTTVPKTERQFRLFDVGVKVRAFVKAML